MMSWEKFDNLSVQEQKKVLRDVFRHTGLMYSVCTKMSYGALEKEYKSYQSVRMFVNDAMERVL